MLTPPPDLVITYDDLIDNDIADIESLLLSLPTTGPAPDPEPAP